ncbi:MAG: ligase-associated DNA damage response exonuclease [Armatimonadetes bacterium]|nr:ligase-associated DNA damage response exonuclease [Armatimonadota bacterium]
MPLITTTDAGLYCAAGGFYIDPWRPVDRAVVTHAHADHATSGQGRVLTTTPGAGVMRARLGPDAAIEPLAYGTRLDLGGVGVSLHPSGHILGAAQVRVEHRGEVWVSSGDYKLTEDPTCAPFEPLRCDTFVTEATFALPIYRWRTPVTVIDDVHAWWRANQERARTSVLLAYSLGKAQRLLALLDPEIGPVLAHGAVLRFVGAYREQGIALPDAAHAEPSRILATKGRALVLAPPSAAGSPWIRRFDPFSLGFASGQMRVRGARRQRAVDRGFVLSDHADWPQLLRAIEASEAERVLVTHGQTHALTRWLQERGRDAAELRAGFAGGEDDG